MDNKSINRKKAIVSELLVFSILASGCAKTSENVILKLKGQEEEKETKPVIEEVIEPTWVEYDESTLMYKVDLDRFLKDKLKLSNKTLENSDVLHVLEIIHEELGEDLYVKDKNDKTLYNLEGKSVSLNSSGERMLYVRLNYNEETDEKLSIIYDVNVEKNGKTGNYSREIDNSTQETLKYYVIYNGKKEYTRSILLRQNRTEYLSIGLHERDINFSSESISFGTEKGDASVKISREDYDTLYEIMLSFKESNNLYDFLSENIELLNKYLIQIQEKDSEYYEYLCNLINEYIEKGKVLRYE